MTAGILDPTISSISGRERPGGPATATQSATVPQVDSLRGKRVGLLENTKRNAAALLDALGTGLAETDHVDLVRMTKQDFAMPLAPDVVEGIIHDCDVVVIGIGDCGSCSAAAVADGIALEERGVPVAVLCTEAFEVTSRAMAGLKGRPDFPVLLMPHPIANLTNGDLTERGQTLASRVRGHFLGPAA
ncbi:UGSC family (seleno)protein [Citricoccus sp.]|uniref:UGSC family (seleno)protein n=1 Tax=Citricoccus sp. TaxID=1978372 RepID=UPI0028BD6EB5|nr:UGSC family (seleno)protein [Citricoccus sp.]